MKKKCNECGHEQNVTTNAKRTTCLICDAKIPLRVLIASLLVIGAVGGSAYADITVIQENLTPQEQKVLDDTAQAKVDGTYIPPVENISPDAVQFTASAIVHQNEDTVPIPFSYSGRHCIENNEGYVSLYTCIWRRYAPDGSMAIWDLEKEEWSSELIVEAEAKAAFVPPTPEKQKLTKEQKKKSLQD